MYHGLLSDKVLESYADADFASSFDCGSYTGQVHVSFGSPVHWGTKKQRTLDFSARAIDILAASHVLQVSLWLGRLIQNSIPDSVFHPIPLLIDKLGAVRV